VVDIYDFEGVEVDLAFGRDGVSVRGAVPNIPSKYLPPGLSISNATLAIELPAASAANRAAYVYVSCGVGFQGMSLEGAVFMQTKPQSRQLFIAVLRDVSLSKFISAIDTGSEWDMALEQASLSFSPQRGSYPQIPLIQERYPWVYQIPNPSGLALSATITQLPNLTELFGIRDVKMTLAVVIGTASQIRSGKAHGQLLCETLTQQPMSLSMR